MRGGIIMAVLSASEVLVKVQRGSAVILFDNVDDCVDFEGFLRVVAFAYGVESPLDLSCVVLK